MRSMNIWVGVFCLAAAASTESLLLLPISSPAENSADGTTLNRLYRDAFESGFKGTLLPFSSGRQSCPDRECATSAARQAEADEVVYSTFGKLGSKWIFSSTIVKPDGSNAFNHRITVSSIEEMETACQQMAIELLKHATGGEEESAGSEPSSSHALSSGGIALGYFWPLGNSFSTSAGKPHEQIIRLSFLNSWELPHDLLLDADVVWGFFDASLGADVNLNYIFSHSDFSPFLGGGLGLHYVFDDYLTDNTRSSGPALNVQGGMLLFRNSDVHLTLRGQYQVIFNTDVEQLAIVDLGISVRKLDFWH